MDKTLLRNCSGLLDFGSIPILKEPGCYALARSGSIQVQEPVGKLLLLFINVLPENFILLFSFDVPACTYVGE